MKIVKEYGRPWWWWLYPFSAKRVVQVVESNNDITYYVDFNGSYIGIVETKDNAMILTPDRSFFVNDQIRKHAGLISMSNTEIIRRKYIMWIIIMFVIILNIYIAWLNYLLPPIGMTHCTNGVCWELNYIGNKLMNITMVGTTIVSMQPTSWSPSPWGLTLTTLGFVGSVIYLIWILQNEFVRDNAEFFSIQLISKNVWALNPSPLTKYSLTQILRRVMIILKEPTWFIDAVNQLRESVYSIIDENDVLRNNLENIVMTRKESFERGRQFELTRINMAMTQFTSSMPSWLWLIVFLIIGFVLGYFVGSHFLAIPAKAINQLLNSTKVT